MSAQKDPQGAGPASSEKAAGPDATSTEKIVAAEVPPPLPPAGGWAARERRGFRELQLPAGISAPCQTTDHVQRYCFPKPLGRWFGVFRSLGLFGLFKYFLH